MWSQLLIAMFYQIVAGFVISLKYCPSAGQNSLSRQLSPVSYSGKCLLDHSAIFASATCRADLRSSCGTHIILRRYLNMKRCLNRVEKICIGDSLSMVCNSIRNWWKYTLGLISYTHVIKKKQKCHEDAHNITHTETLFRFAWKSVREGVFVF